MAECIEREAAIEAVTVWYKKACQPENMSSYNMGERAAYTTAISEILELPTADVRPVARGKWKKRMEEKETPYYKSFTPIWSCSECGTEYDPSFCITINFCPKCGAMMEES